MKNIRISVVLLTGWLIFVFYIETLLASTFHLEILQSGVAALLVAGILLTLVVPRLNPVVDWLLLGLPVVTLFLVRALTGLFSDGLLMVCTVIDILALIVAMALTFRIRLALDAFEAAVVRMTFGRDDRQPQSEVSGASYLYREVRRARNHQRPFSLIAIAVDENTSNPTVDRMIQEVQAAMMKQFSLASVSKTLCESLEDCAVIVREKDHFLVALPETKAEEIPIIINRLRKQVSERAGVDLLVGSATLPKDSYTFEGLVSIAKDGMKPATDTQPLPESSLIPAKKSLTH